MLHSFDAAKDCSARWAVSSTVGDAEVAVDALTEIRTIGNALGHFT